MRKRWPHRPSARGRENRLSFHPRSPESRADCQMDVGKQSYFGLSTTLLMVALFIDMPPPAIPPDKPKASPSSTYAPSIAHPSEDTDSPSAYFSQLSLLSPVTPLDQHRLPCVLPHKDMSQPKPQPPSSTDQLRLSGPWVDQESASSISSEQRVTPTTDSSHDSPAPHSPADELTSLPNGSFVPSSLPVKEVAPPEVSLADVKDEPVFLNGPIILVHDESNDNGRIPRDDMAAELMCGDRNCGTVCTSAPPIAQAGVSDTLLSAQHPEPNQITRQDNVELSPAGSETVLSNDEAALPPAEELDLKSPASPSLPAGKKKMSLKDFALRKKMQREAELATRLEDDVSIADSVAVEEGRPISPTIHNPHHAQPVDDVNMGSTIPHLSNGDAEEGPPVIQNAPPSPETFRHTVEHSNAAVDNVINPETAQRLMQSPSPPNAKLPVLSEEKLGLGSSTQAKEIARRSPSPQRPQPPKAEEPYQTGITLSRPHSIRSRRRSRSPRSSHSRESSQEEGEIVAQPSPPPARPPPQVPPFRRANPPTQPRSMLGKPPPTGPRALRNFGGRSIPRGPNIERERDRDRDRERDRRGWRS
jgi:hypothetical protein